MIAAPERDVHCPRDEVIGCKRSLAGQQPRILDAFDARADVQTRQTRRGSATRLTRAPMFFGRNAKATSAASGPDACSRPSVSTVAGLIDRRSLSRLNGGPDKDPVSLPICVAASIVVLPFVMRFYLGGFGVKRQIQEAPLARALGSRSLE